MAELEDQESMQEDEIAYLVTLLGCAIAECMMKGDWSCKRLEYIIKYDST